MEAGTQVYFVWGGTFRKMCAPGTVEVRLLERGTVVSSLEGCVDVRLDRPEPVTVTVCSPGRELAPVRKQGETRVREEKDED